MARAAARERLPFSSRQHRAQEIHWHPWGQNAFQIAQREDKPILLALTAWWCDDCHRMDEAGYSDPRVISRIKESYVAIRVDSDRRPDVNDRYTQGVWPTVALLAPTGELLTSGGSLGADELAALLDRVSIWYDEQHAELRQEVLDMEARRQELLQYTLCPPDEPTPELLQRVASDLQGRYDPLYGGFGDQPKFPYADALRFALRQMAMSGGEAWSQMVALSLDSLAAGLLDQVEGGFFRSADRRDWSHPHTEKLLEVNAELLSLYLEAFQTTRNEGYRIVADRVLAYLDSALRNEGAPTFAGSQAADSDYYGLDSSRRAGASAPAVDRTVFAEGNARVAIAYLLAFQLWSDPGQLQKATRLLDFLWTEMSNPEQGVVRYWDGRPGGPHLLRDQVWVASAMAEAYDVTGDDRFLEKATLLAEVILRDYAGLPGGFHDIRAERDALGGLANRQWNLVENAQVARLMVRLAIFGGDGRYLEAARSALQLFSQDFSRFGPLEGSYALALEEYFRGKTG